ncbi:MAG: CHAT domain-containing protein [Phenylobacterium sp.]|uniref:CHAT domain-containing protein n=1 Tax=Phenylobacterium sp. TaxID=1871053 RepID=UPI0025DED6AD|nr:CHAT domain-containing protein [Phenylobacterium sp.]MBI1198921.1 CHAT domain-containing protein [Phenylobacterium sp.]
MSRLVRSSAALAAIAAGIAGAAAGTAGAAPLPEVFPLGQSSASGAVCEAVRDYQDPLGQGAQAKAWRVRCRGYDTVLGRLYELPKSGEAAWRAALAARAECGASAPAPGGLPASLAKCRAGGQGGAPYIAYSSDKDGKLTVAEGLAPLSDVVETSLKVALGLADPPASTDIQTSAAQAEIAADFPDLGGLAAAEAAAAADPRRLSAHGYVQNNEWRFDEAETAFRALVSEGEAANAPAAQRADALLNLAMNISNSGRFDEAQGYFDEADTLIPADDVLLRARSLNYRALHERNRRRFPEAIRAARAALQLRASAGGGATQAASGVQAAAGGALVIDAGTARKLNTPSAAQSQIETTRVTPAERLAVQDAQAWQVIGTSQAEMGDVAAARASLARARDILSRNAALGRLTAWLQARVAADIAGLDLDAGRATQAVDGYAAGLKALRTRHAGSAAEGAMLLDLGRAQVAAGRDADALASYGAAMAIFRAQRGGLGDSADASQPYFDLLLKLIAQEPDRAAEYGGLFFDGAETVVSSATAETVNRLAARVAAGDGAIAGLSRAFEDARRRVRATESQIAALQADGLYTETVRTEMEGLLKGEQETANALEARMLAANPRYNQLVAPGAPAADVQAALRPGEVYLKILPLAGRTYGVLLTAGEVKPYAIEMTRDQVDAAVTRARLPLEPTDTLTPFDTAGAAALFSRLFGPVRDEVVAARHLIYEPDGPLVSLPVALLVTDTASIHANANGEVDYTRVAWLGRRVASSLVVSGASFLQSRKFAPSAARRPYLGFADPALPRAEERAYTSVTRSFLRRSVVMERVCGETRDALLRIEALPETAAEVRSVGESLGTPGSVVTGEAFSDDAVRRRSDLADYHVLYFATHGLLPQPDACVPEPALVTSLGTGDSDALLDTSEILNLKIDADLVVLAACDTGGAGAGVDRTGLKGGGEALGGLTRAMIYAGSRALIVSHWSIESESAVRLMTGLFASGAPTMAQALQASQAALQDDPRYAHPYFWAPFTLVGDGARPLPGVSRQVAAAQD